MPSTPIVHTGGLDGGPRGSGAEILSALGSSQKKRLFFFADEDKAVGSHAVTDLAGVAQSVDSVQTWDRCSTMLLTSADKREAVLLMDTETGTTTSELSLRRERKGWNLRVDSIAPMQKFEQYRSGQDIALYGLGDNGRTVFHLQHDGRTGENVEQHVIGADACRKYKSYVFTCQAQSGAGYLALGRSDGAVALYDAVMKKEDATTVLNGQPGPVTAVDLSADGSELVWTTPDFIFFAALRAEHWARGQKEKPRAMRLDVRPEDAAALGLPTPESEGEEGEEVPPWLPAQFDAGAAAQASGARERRVVSYAGHVQLAWELGAVRAAYEDGAAVCYGVPKAVSARSAEEDEAADEEAADENSPPSSQRQLSVCSGAKQPSALRGSAVAFHRQVLGGVGESVDVVALGGEIVKSLRF